jgi:hypothetical protein
MHKGELSLENLLESKTVILDKHSAREGLCVATESLFF